MTGQPVPPGEAVPLAVWSGQLADGKSAALVDVCVEHWGSELVLRPLDPALPAWRWSLQGLKLDGMREHEALELEHAEHPGMLLTVARGEEARRALRTRVRPGVALPGGKHPRVYAAVVLGLVLGLAALGYWSVSPLSRFIAQRIPLEYERRLGSAATTLFERQICPSDAARAALRKMLYRLGGELGPEQRVGVLNFGAPNAFTFPGGDILVTRGLVEEAESADEVAGVLAHELAHVRQRHVMSELVRSTILAAAWSATVGDYSGLFVVDPATAFQIANLRFTRADEASADREAFERLREAGIPLGGLRDFFRRMAEKYPQGSEWLSSHPDSQRRADEAAAAAGIPSAPAAPVLSGEDWSALKEACSGRQPVEDLSDLWGDD